MSKNSKVKMVYVWLRNGVGEMANVQRDDNSTRTYRLTPSNYSRLERMSDEFSKKHWFYGRKIATHFSIILDRRGMDDPNSA